MKLLAGNSNLPLSRSISEYLEMPLTQASVRRFATRDFRRDQRECPRPRTSSSSSRPPIRPRQSDGTADLHRRAAPRVGQKDHGGYHYFGYARQDRKQGPRTPISAKLVANLITVAGAPGAVDRPHAGQIRASSTSDRQSVRSPVIAADIQARFSNGNLNVVSPDVGGVVRARSLAKRLNNSPWRSSTSAREKPANRSDELIGEVERAQLHPDDDIVDSGGRCAMRRRAQAAGANGKSSLIAPTACCPAAPRRAFGKSELSELVVTDSICTGEPDPRTARSAADHRPAARRGDRRNRQTRAASPASSTKRKDDGARRHPQAVRAAGRKCASFELGRFELSTWEDDGRARDLSAGVEMVGARRRGARQASCMVEHVGMVVSGRGRRGWTTASHHHARRRCLLYPPGHDSWVVGDEPMCRCTHGRHHYADDAEVLVTGANAALGWNLPGNMRRTAGKGWRPPAIWPSRRASRPGRRADRDARHGRPRVGGRFSKRIEGPLDLLIANAGTYQPETVQTAEDARGWARMMIVNAIGPFVLARSLLEQVAEARGKLIAISSDMGSIASNRSGGYVPYRSSKSALNSAWRSLAIEARPKGIIVAAFNPGWVKTRMGGPHATLPPEQSIAQMRALIDGLGPEQSSGFFERDGRVIPW